MNISFDVRTWQMEKIRGFRPGDGSPSATNVVLVVVVVIRLSIPLVPVVSQPIVMKLFSHINDNMRHQATGSAAAAETA